MWFYIGRYFRNFRRVWRRRKWEKGEIWKSDDHDLLRHHSSYMKRIRKASLCPVSRQTFQQKWRTSPTHYSSRVYKVSMTSEPWESVSRTKGTKSFTEVKMCCFCYKVTTACRVVGHSDTEDMRIASRLLGNRSRRSLDWGAVGG